MVTWALENLMNAVVQQGEITRADVLTVQRDILPNGIQTRDEADMLIALDRAVLERDPIWRDFLVQSVVSYVVWTCRPTGRVDAEEADWLIRSLSCGAGPSDNAVAIAFEVAREAEGVDEALVAFVLRWSASRSRAVVDTDAVTGL